MKYRLGDSIRIDELEKYSAIVEAAEQMLRDVLGGLPPKIKTTVVTLTTQEMVDEYNLLHGYGNDTK